MRKRIETGKKTTTFDKEFVTKHEPLLIASLPATRSAVGQINHILFFKDKIATYNGISMSVVPINLSFEGSVRSNDFLQILRNSDGSKFKLEVKSNVLSIILNERSVAKYALFEADEIHKVVDAVKYDNMDWEEMPDDIIKGIQLCSFCAPSSSTNVSLAGVAIVKGEVFATDMHRLAFMKTKHKRINLVLPAMSTKYLPRIATNNMEFCFDEKMLHLKTEIGFFSVSLMDYEISIDKIKSVIPKEKDLTFFDMPHKMKKAVDRALVFYESQDRDLFAIEKSASLEFSKGQIKLECQSEGRGGYSEIIPTKVKVKNPFKFYINPVFLKEALAFNCRIAMNKDERSVVIKTDEEKFVHIIMLTLS